MLAAGGLAWSAVRAPGPPTLPTDYTVRILHNGKQLGVEPVRVPRWERNLLVTLDVTGSVPNAAGLCEGSLRTWIVGGEAPEAYPRRNYDFRGHAGTVQCPIPVPTRLPCRVVVSAEDYRGHRETRSFAIDAME